MSPQLHPSPFESARLIVLKLGSAVLTTGGGELDISVMTQICEEIAELLKRGRKVVLVTSAAVAAGRSALGVKDRKPTIAVKQALAAVGQTRLMQIYTELFARHGVIVGQMLLSRSDMEDRRRYVNARYTLEELLRRECVPIINENDTVTVDELRFGDNDGLAAIVAVKMQADALLLLSDVDGLYDSNPKLNKNARLLEHIDRITPAMLDAAEDGHVKGAAQLGSGGMTSKVQAAQVATTAGVCVAIAHGKRQRVLHEILSGQFHGTFFTAEPCRHTRRRQWILAGKTAGRRVIVDEGAREALVAKKKSLLPAGVHSIEGEFQPQDLVDIVDARGNILGRGVINYSSQELQRIKGRKTADIESILGSKPYDEAIHRDNLALNDV
ncbi:MAG: glutamate 5-kinase [Candidatus Sumerlaeaceae bacterium]